MTQHACWYIYTGWWFQTMDFRHSISFLWDVIRKPLTSCPSFFKRVIAPPTRDDRTRIFSDGIWLDLLEGLRNFWVLNKSTQNRKPNILDSRSSASLMVDGPGWYPLVSSNMTSLLGRSWKCRIFPHAMFDETEGLPYEDFRLPGPWWKFSVFFCFETASEPRRFYPKHSNSYQRQARLSLGSPLEFHGDCDVSAVVAIDW